MKVHRVASGSGPFEYMLFCPGCQCGHGFNTKTWTFNGDMERPTIHPSLLTWWTDDKGDQRCHSFVRNGMIQFLDDCTHALRGQTVPLEDF